MGIYAYTSFLIWGSISISWTEDIKASLSCSILLCCIMQAYMKTFVLFNEIVHVECCIMLQQELRTLKAQSTSFMLFLVPVLEWFLCRCRFSSSWTRWTCTTFVTYATSRWSNIEKLSTLILWLRGTVSHSLWNQKWWTYSLNLSINYKVQFGEGFISIQL